MRNSLVCVVKYYMNACDKNERVYTGKITDAISSLQCARLFIILSYWCRLVILSFKIEDLSFLFLLGNNVDQICFICKSLYSV